MWKRREGGSIQSDVKRNRSKRRQKQQRAGPAKRLAVGRNAAVAVQHRWVGQAAAAEDDREKRPDPPAPEPEAEHQQREPRGPANPGLATANQGIEHVTAVQLAQREQ